jgi:glucokinase
VAVTASSLNGNALAGHGYIGAIDLGGTKILASIAAPDGTIVSRAKKMTRADRGAETVVERMTEAVREAAAEAGIDVRAIVAAGVGAPGPIDTANGVVKQAPNLGWDNFPLRDALSTRLGCPVSVGNDVSVAVLAEHAAGAGRGVRHLVGIWPGTGVGGGMIMDGKLYGGVGDLAGEVGHMTIKAGGPKCGCGGRGHLEALCSRTAIVREIAKMVKRGAKSEITKIAGGNILQATSGDLAKALLRGDKVVMKVLDRASKHLALGIASVANLLNPEMVVLGGGVIEALGDPFVERVTELVRKQPLRAATADLKIVKSQLGDDAGITGAALLARQIQL